MQCNLRVYTQVYFEVIGHCIFKAKVWQEILVCVCVRNVCDVCILGNLVDYNWLVLYSNWIRAYANTLGR